MNLSPFLIIFLISWTSIVISKEMLIKNVVEICTILYLFFNIYQNTSYGLWKKFWHNCLFLDLKDVSYFCGLIYTQTPAEISHTRMQSSIYSYKLLCTVPFLSTLSFYGYWVLIGLFSSSYLCYIDMISRSPCIIVWTSNYHHW